MAGDPDPYAGKDAILADVTKPTVSLMNLGNEEDTADSPNLYKPRVAADNSAPSKHGALIGGITSLLTGDPRIGASVATHLDQLGIGQHDPMLGQNLQAFASLLSGDVDKTVKQGQQAEAQATQMAAKAGQDAERESQRVASALAAQTKAAASGGGKSSGGDSGGGGGFASLFG